jgi:hypothetical protein
MCYDHQRCEGECEDHAGDGVAAFHSFFFRLAARRCNDGDCEVGASLSRSRPRVRSFSITVQSFSCLHR